MHYEVLTDCWPYGLALLASVAALRVLVWLSGARWCGTRLPGLHRDQAGAVQSLSFVLTLPIFIIILLFIVQITVLRETWASRGCIRATRRQTL
jgi:cobalamin synthase